MAGLGTTEILIILAVVLLLFGSTKLPTLARSLGKSARILKAETKGLHDDDDDDKPAKSEQAQADPGAEQDKAAKPARDASDGGAQRPRGALGSGEPIQGVPVSDPGQVRKSG
ncbi:twin-arginine translocase TatA/TatE family subunit [Actinomadura sp. KC06]|uniref:Sec-independent protein translocase subunit TatA n=1 Tax=Actinomadura sp. KC06 TaxID=2530369 RepID=UPI001042E0EF|nr:Sec-independent protein translocase subunit TatA [Actinomadura sp. KC06]TDD20002.1 twin-arginine translocase TatA/TatE family subunit [Actinomadura sp. KC06]